MRLSFGQYKVAWICPLELVEIAAIEMLDEEHEDLPQSAADHNIYSLGSVYGHNVVIAGTYQRNSSAATVMTHIRMTFPNLEFCILVGIGGGVPVQTKNGLIRLGHVVVSKPTREHSGAIQYDHGKAIDGYFQRTGALAPPPAVLLNAGQALQTQRARMEIDPVQQNVKRIDTTRQFFRRFQYPGSEHDHLYQPEYSHVQRGESCNVGGCDPAQRIPRASDDYGDTYVTVHQGTIASGELVIADAMLRDALAKQCGLVCFEMEAAGAPIDFPCIVVRGISGYCDSHKNDQWRGYAAAVAAAYARELCSNIPTYEEERMNNLAFVLESEGKFNEAEKMYRRTLELRREVLGYKHPNTLDSIADLASILRSQGKYNEAEQMYRRTLELRREVLGDMHPSTLDSIANLASMFSIQGEYEESEQMYRQALELRQKMLGPNHSDTLNSMNNLTSTLENQGKYEEAEKMYRQILELRQKMLGPHHSDTLNSMNNLASTLENQGKYEEAEKMYRQILELRQKMLGPNHSDILDSMNNLASTYWNQRRWKDAEKLGVKVMHIRRRMLGDGHLNTLASMANLASTYWNQQRWEEAKELEKWVVEASVKMLGEEHPIMLTSINGFFNGSQGIRSKLAKPFSTAKTAGKKAPGARSREWTGHLRCEWEVPALYKKMREASPLSTKADVFVLLSRFIILTGDEEQFECSTCADFLHKRWHHEGLNALRVISTGIRDLFFQGTVSEALSSADPKSTDNSSEGFRVDGFEVLRSTTKDIDVKFLRYGPRQRELAEAIVWTCAAMRSCTGASSSNDLGLFKSTSTKSISFFGNRSFKLLCKLQPLEEWYPDTSCSSSSCWAKLFHTGVIAWHPLQRHWGKGLEVSFDMMVHLASVENYSALDVGVILLGFRTALVPVDWDEDRKLIQWHFEVIEDSMGGFIKPAELRATKQSWVKFQDTSKFRDSRCFVGWFEMAHILLGTRELLDTATCMTWSKTEECRQTLRSKGLEAGAQIAISTGPINIAPQVMKTWEFVSSVQRYIPTNQYRQTLHTSHGKVAIVIDSDTKQAWLVPMLSLILHLCHVYFNQVINRGRVVNNPIPFAEPSYDGCQAVLDAIEMKGDIILLGKPGDTDTETLRQLFLRIHTSLVDAASTREEPKQSTIFATELMATIDPPLRGSALRMVDVSGSNSLVGSWGPIIRHVDVIGVCARLGRAIRPILTHSQAFCLNCCTLPVDRFYLAAHMQCLGALSERAGSSINDLTRGVCQLGSKTFWCIENTFWMRCLPENHAPIWGSDASCQFLQHISTERPRNGTSLLLQGPVKTTGVVVFGDVRRAEHSIKRIWEKMRNKQ